MDNKNALSVKQALGNVCKRLFALNQDELMSLIEKHKKGDIAQTVLQSGMLDASTQASEIMDNWNNPDVHFSIGLKSIIHSNELSLEPLISFNIYDSQPINYCIGTEWLQSTIPHGLITDDIEDIEHEMVSFSRSQPIYTSRFVNNYEAEDNDLCQAA